MSSHTPTDRHSHTATTARIEAFSDAVIAIIITLLILEIRVPELHNLTTMGIAHSLTPLLYLSSLDLWSVL